MVLEEADDTGEEGVIVTRVLVNGVDVGKITETPKISVGTKSSGSLTTITLTLAPSRLEIRGEHADGERRAPRAGFAAKID
ncbi:hypothetical protein [Streptomyces sp. DH12]|uniref:hypothetical protein n=1 Tax=Streptomyces sp. DH12 TaxID=2857010 RepID=UPI001E46F201|nr:hypothetical protein [Streptomyces sp. DH12]